METETEIPGEAGPDEPAEEARPAPKRFLGLELGDLLPFCILIGFSAWLWARASATLGSGAPLLGAVIGLAIAFLVRAFC
jgi:hypothetical protein